MRTRITSLILIITCLFLLTACENPLYDTGDDIEEPTDFSIHVLHKEDLEDGFFYIKHGEEFYQIPYGIDSFDNNAELEQKYVLSRGNDFQGDTYKTIYYERDKTELQIPTMFADDELVFKTNETVANEFEWGRFIDGGYTLGIRNIQKDDTTGLYYVSNYFNNTIEGSPFSEILGHTEETEGDETTMAQEMTNSFEGGDSEEINPANYNVYTLGSVNEINLRPTASGTAITTDIVNASGVLNTPENVEYDCKFFKGTKLFEIKEKPNYRYFYNFENYIAGTVEFTDDGYAVLKVPEFFKSGYYKTNMSGLFRYIDRPYDKSIDIYKENYNHAYYKLDKNKDQIIMDEAQHFVYEKEYQPE